MTIQTKNSVAELKHRRNLCSLGESALLVDSLVQAYMSGWFINLPAIIGGPG